MTPAAASTPPDDTPSIRVGATIFTNYSYQTEPEITDSDGNLVHRSGFDVTRSYINVTGNLSHIVAFRITPDIVRETNPASSLAGSLIFRIKYAFLQANLDDWMSRGSWARFGIQQTPYLDFMEGIYRYRFQGTMFVERARLHVVGGRRRVLPLQPAVELRRRARRASTTARTTAAPRSTIRRA